MTNIVIIGITKLLNRQYYTTWTRPVHGSKHALDGIVKYVKELGKSLAETGNGMRSLNHLIFPHP